MRTTSNVAMRTSKLQIIMKRQRTTNTKHENNNNSAKTFIFLSERHKFIHGNVDLYKCIYQSC